MRTALGTMQTLTPGILYKHLNNRDVAFLPIEVTEQSDGLRLSGSWLNVVNPENIHFIDSDQIFIKSSDVEKWVRYEPKIPY